jgi:hypothetical protein
MTDWKAIFKDIADATAKESVASDGSGPANAPPPLPELTDAVIMAAITDTFRSIPYGPPLPDDILAGDEEAALLAHSVAVIIGGQRRLRLSDGARADLLRKAADLPRVGELLRQAVDYESRPDIFDEITGNPARQANAWLRCFLAGKLGDIHRAPPDELRAALTARASLTGCALLDGIPTTDDLRRALSYAELLEPLRILIGSESGWAGHEPWDRFAGRKKELERLRSFVDELESHSIGETIRRGVARGVETAAGWFGLTKASLLTVIAGGGLGKSALIAKFVLEHAVRHSEPDRRSFPFVYMDFDRATVRTTDSRLLLLEVLRQLSFQYPSAAGDLGALAETLRSTLGGALTPERDPYLELRRILRDFAGVGERRFLLVLDTFEVVQFDQQTLEAVDNFLARLIGAEGFPELRIVIAGREELEQGMLFPVLVVTAQPLALRPLNVSDAVEMANKLGASLMDQEWNPRWARRIAGKATEDKSGRREPLSIRVAVDLLKSESPEKRDELSLEIKAKGEKAHASFVGTLYQRRVLGHVRGGSAVGKLAWPGLVFRNVTIDIVQEVLAPMCGLTYAAADEAFDLLGKEVWLVDVVEEPTGKVLRHKRELRARTLPLMRRHKEKTADGKVLSFDDVNIRAIEYYRDRRTLPGSRAEWIYHRLLAGESPESVDEQWSDECRTRLSDAAFDFEPDDRAQMYLLGKTTSRLVTPRKLAGMRQAGAWIVFDHVERVAPELGDFDDVAVRPEVIELAKTQKPGRLRPETEAVRRTILAKAGQWGSQPLSVGAASPWASRIDFASRFLRAHNALYDIGEAELAADAVQGTQAEVYRSLAQDLATAAILGNVSTYQAIDERLSYCIEDLRPMTPRLDGGSLRMAAIFGNRSCTPAARLLLATMGSFPTCSGDELRLIVSEMGADFVMRVLPDEAGLIDAALQATGPLRIEGLKLGKLLSEAYDAMPTKGIQRIRKFFSLRREDWVTVFGYACARSVPKIDSALSDQIKERLDQYVSHIGRSWYDRSFWRSPDELWDSTVGGDFISLMRIADEASDLAGMARVIEEAIPQPDGVDLRRLLNAEKTWSGNIERLAVAEGGDASERPPQPGKVIDESDPQKGRWGGLAELDGRRLMAKFTDTKSSWTFQVDLIVESTDGSELLGPVVFHLHHTFSSGAIHIRRVQEKRRCVLYDVRAWGAFTIGAQVRDEHGRWIGLELNLADLSELPRKFRGR